MNRCIPLLTRTGILGSRTFIPTSHQIICPYCHSTHSTDSEIFPYPFPRTWTTRSPTGRTRPGLLRRDSVQKTVCSYLYVPGISWIKTSCISTSRLLNFRTPGSWESFSSTFSGPTPVECRIKKSTTSTFCAVLAHHITSVFSFFFVFSFPMLTCAPR